MRMKKLMLFAAMAAIAVSCAKTSEVNPVSEQAIGFDTWTDNLTKSTHLDFPDGAKFDVYGFKQAGTTKTTVFDGDDVTKDGAAWNYAQIRSWDRATDSYTFFAISPANITTTEPSPAQTGLFVTNDITFTGKNNDVLISKRKEVLKKDYGTEVHLVFLPKASLFDLKVKKAKNLKEAELKINSVSIKNIKTSGHLTVTGYEDDDTPNISWALAATPTTANFNNHSGITSVDFPVIIEKSVEHGIDHSEFLINNLVVMPQTLDNGESGQQLEINYSVTFSGETLTHTRTIQLNKFDNTDMKGEGRDEIDQNGETGSAYITTWDPGKHYTYYLTINADLIVFSAEISNWTDVNAFHYIID